jgi:hypothetical protein
MSFCDTALSAAWALTCRDMRGQPAGRGKAGELRLRSRQALGLELLEQCAGKGITQLLQRLGGSSSTNSSTRRLFFGHVMLSGGLLRDLATHSRGAMGKPSRSRLS